MQKRRSENDRDRDNNGQEQRHPEHEPVRPAHVAPGLVLDRLALGHGDRQAAP